MSDGRPYTTVTPGTMPKSALKKTGRQRVIEMVTGIRPGTIATRNPRSLPTRLGDFLEEGRPNDFEVHPEGDGGGATIAVQQLR